MITPLNDNVIVKIEKPEDQYDGIAVADTTPKLQEIAEVLAIGPDAAEDPRANALKVGDRIVFKSYFLEEMDIAGEKVGVIKYTDITGVLND